MKIFIKLYYTLTQNNDRELLKVQFRQLQER